jgi:polysaccharide export outer membrane protein
MNVTFDVIPRMRRRGTVLRCLATLGLSLTLMSCGTVADNLPPAPGLPAAMNGPPPDLPPYRIQRGDVLDLRFYQTPELNEEVTVRPDGHISTSLIKDERAYGLTVPELTDVLQKDYSEYVLKVSMTLIVKAATPDRIYVAGEVTAPGEFITLPPNLTLSQAIARAGGLKISGSPDKIIILRRGPDNTPEIFQTSYAGVTHGSNAAADVQLENYDVVYVPRTSIAEFYTYYNQYLQQFLPVTWGFNYLLNQQQNNANTGAAAATK